MKKGIAEVATPPPPARRCCPTPRESGFAQRVQGAAHVRRKEISSVLSGPEHNISGKTSKIF